MKEIVKTFIIIVIVVAAFFAFTSTALKAWDAQYEADLKKDFGYKYEYRYEFGYDLLNDEYLESVRDRMPEDFKFADWGYPEFDEGDK